MPRSGKVKPRDVAPDPVYGSRQIASLVNRVMKAGKKKLAFKQAYQALEIVAKRLKKEPALILQQALENVRPTMEVRSRRVGGAAYQVPIRVKSRRGESLAIRWLILAARKRPNREYVTFAQKLAAELSDAFENKGGAVEKKEEVQRMAKANKAFAHFRW